MRSAFVLSALGLLAAACQELPGEVVGTYSVSLALDEDTCGQGAVYSLDGKRYSVELRAHEHEAYWHIAGQSPLPGSYEEPHYRFQYGSVVAQHSDDAGTHCRLMQDEELKARIMSADQDGGVPSDAGDAGSQLVGEHVMTISAASGSDCALALAPRGAFGKLPCLLRYKLTGTPRKPL